MKCALCQERIDPEQQDDMAEMYDPTSLHDAELVHAQCGLWAGWEVA